MPESEYSTHLHLPFTLRITATCAGSPLAPRSAIVFTITVPFGNFFDAPRGLLA